MNILLNKKFDNGAALAAARYDKLVYEYLTDEERTELAALRHPRRRQERLAAIYILREVMGVKNTLYHRANGQPALLGSPMNISIAHSSDGIAGVLLHHRSAGLDIENKKRNFAALGRKYLSAQEQGFINNNELCGIAWCAKEAAYKAAGIAGLDWSRGIMLRPFAISDDSITAEIVCPQKQEVMIMQKITLPQHWVVVAIN